MTVQVDVDTPMEAWADGENETIHLTIGQTAVNLDTAGASRLVDALQQKLKALDPHAYACDECLDTGERYVPIARGAVTISSCHCPAARR